MPKGKFFIEPSIIALLLNKLVDIERSLHTLCTQMNVIHTQFNMLETRSDRHEARFEKLESLMGEAFCLFNDRINTVEDRNEKDKKFERLEALIARGFKAVNERISVLEAQQKPNEAQQSAA